MEKDLKIKIPGTKKYIYGKLRGSLKRPLIVFVHGLTGHMDEHLFFNGARYFEKQGFSTFRFNLYDWHKEARKMTECTVKTHASDLDVVAASFRKKGVKQIGVVGHSLGGPTILLSTTEQFDRIVLWDPTHDVYSKNIFNDLRYVNELKAYVPKKEDDEEWGFEVVIGTAMTEEGKQLKYADRLKEIQTPLRIICAGQDKSLSTLWKSFLKKNRLPVSFLTIPNAGHTFDEDGTEEKLFAATLDWFRKMSSVSR